jgi:hypothetical protein
MSAAAGQGKEKGEIDLRFGGLTDLVVSLSDAEILELLVSLAKVVGYGVAVKAIMGAIDGEK